MASSLQPNSIFLKHPLLPKLPSSSGVAATTTASSYIPIRCGGPRSHRGPLVKGRILSIEAIQAIQTLKRLQRTNPDNFPNGAVSSILSRLIKSDLMATLRELLRQDQCALALQAFYAVRSEYHADLTLYAEMIQALARNGMAEDVDRLILDLEGKGGIRCDDKGLVNLIKAVIGAERRESTVRIYGLMKKSGWGSVVAPDEYVAKVLYNGLRNFGEEAVAKEVENEYRMAFGRFYKGKFEKLEV